MLKVSSVLLLIALPTLGLANDVSTKLYSHPDSKTVQLVLKNNTAKDLFCSKLQIETNVYEVGSRRLQNRLVTDVYNTYLPANKEIAFEGEDVANLPENQVVGDFKMTNAADCWAIPSFVERCEFGNISGAELKTISQVLSSNQLRSCQDLVDLSPPHISLEGNGFDLNVLQPLKFITSLRLLDTDVSILPNLSQFVNLKSVDLSYSTFTDISAVSNLPRIEVLDLRGLHLKDVSVLASLSSLKHLDVRGATIPDVSAAAYLVNTCIQYEGLVTAKNRDTPKLLRTIKSNNRTACKP